MQTLNHTKTREGLKSQRYPDELGTTPATKKIITKINNLKMQKSLPKAKQNFYLLQVATESRRIIKLHTLNKLSESTGKTDYIPATFNKHFCYRLVLK